MINIHKKCVCGEKLFNRKRYYNDEYDFIEMKFTCRNCGRRFTDVYHPELKKTIEEGNVFSPTRNQMISEIVEFHYDLSTIDEMLDFMRYMDSSMRCEDLIKSTLRHTMYQLLMQTPLEQIHTEYNDILEFKDFNVHKEEGNE